MARYCGHIGYAVTVETSPGVNEEQITTRKYYGDLRRDNRRLQAATDQLNDNINVANVISIVADPFAVQNFHAMRYAELMGTNWKITNVEVKFPRLELTLGGVWNGQ